MFDLQALRRAETHKLKLRCLPMSRRIIGREERLNADLLDRARSTVRIMRAHYRDNVLLGHAEAGASPFNISSNTIALAARASDPSQGQATVGSPTQTPTQTRKPQSIPTAGPRDLQPTLFDRVNLSSCELARHDNARYKDVCAAHWQMLPRRFDPEFARSIAVKQSDMSPMARRKAAAARLHHSALSLDGVKAKITSEGDSAAFGFMRKPRPSPAKRYYRGTQKVLSPQLTKITETSAPRPPLPAANDKISLRRTAPITTTDSDWKALPTYATSPNNIGDISISQEPATCHQSRAGDTNVIFVSRPVQEQKPQFRPSSASTSIQIAPVRTISRPLQYTNAPDQLNVDIREYTPVSRAVRACATRYREKLATTLLSTQTLAENKSHRPSAGKTYASFVAKVGEPLRKGVTLQHRARAYSNSNTDLEWEKEMGNIIEVPKDNDVLCLILLDPK